MREHLLLADPSPDENDVFAAQGGRARPFVWSARHLRQARSARSRSRRIPSWVHGFEHPSPAPAPVVLALEEAIAEARRFDGARGVVDLLVGVLTDPRISDDTQIARYLDVLKAACRQTARYRDAMPVFDRISELNPARRHEMMAERALAHAHCRERSAGTAILRTAIAEQRRLPYSQRDSAFHLVAELAALALQQPELARRAASLRKTTGPAANR